MSPPPRFAIYYADGSVVEGGGPEDEYVDVTIRVSRDWLNAPADRVLMIVAEGPNNLRQGFRATARDVQDPPLREALLECGSEVMVADLYGTEWYFPLEGGSEYGFAEDIGAWLRKLGGVVKRGEYVSAATMEQAHHWAKGYRKIPRK